MQFELFDLKAYMSVAFVDLDLAYNLEPVSDLDLDEVTLLQLLAQKRSDYDLVVCGCEQ